MLKSFLLSFLKCLTSVPAATAALFALREAANRAGFEKQYPAAHDKLASFLNTLIAILVEHAVGYVIICALVGFVWALIVVEPKTKSKSRFEKRRSNLRS